MAATVNVVVRLPLGLLARLERRRREARLTRDTFVNQALDYAIAHDQDLTPTQPLVHLAPPPEYEARDVSTRLIGLARLHNFETTHVVDVRIGEFDQRVTCRECPWEREPA